MSGNSELGRMVDFSISLGGVSHFGGTVYHATFFLRTKSYDSFLLSVMVSADSLAEVPEKARLELVRFAKELLEKASDPDSIKGT
jgi:hypothetical protein